MSARISSLPTVVAANIVDTDIMPIVAGVASNTMVTKRISISELRLKLTSYGAADTGAVDLRYPIGNVKRYGAKGDGVTDDTVAMQAAHATGNLIYYPTGVYKFSLLTGILSGGILGDGPGKTILNSTDATTAAGVISYTGSLPAGGGFTGAFATNIPRFVGFALMANAAKTVGAGLRFVPATGETSYIYLENVIVSSFPIGIDFVAASLFKMIGCDIFTGTVAGVQIANTNVQDSGDSVIMGCTFQGNIATSGPAILYKSSAGLKVVGNKLNVGAYGIRVQWTGSGSGDLVFSSNSVENMTVAGVSLEWVAAAAAMHNVTINDNEFSLCQNTIQSDTNSFLLTVVISDNVISMASSGTTKGIVLTAVTGLIITGNAFRDNGGTSTAIALTSCDLVTIGVNSFLAVGTKTVFTTCTNLFDHTPYSGTVVLPNVTATTAFTLPAGMAMYEVYAALPAAAGGAAAVSMTARIIADNTALFISGSNTTAGFTVTISGLNVQLNQNTGVSQTLTWGYRRIA